MKKELYIMLILIMGFFYSNAQYTLAGDDGETIFTHTGSVNLGSYTPGQVYTLTLCSDDPMCSQMCVSFETWVLGSGNYCIFDGTSTSSPLIGCNAWGPSQSGCASVGNPTGCITIQFTSPVSGSSIGGTIGCSFVCQSVLASVVSTDPPASYEDGVYYIDICQGEEISLQASGVYQNTTYAQSDASSSFSWNFGDLSTASGHAVSHTYASDHGYDVNLTITDVAGCNSTNDIGYRVRVSRTPNFSAPAPGTFINPNSICQGDEVVLTGNVSSEPYVSLYVPVIADTMYIPDGDSCYESSIFYDCFAPGQTLEDVEDLLGICAIIEHSYLGDLLISITCPNNDAAGGGPVTVTLESQHGDGTYLGVPVDDVSGGPDGPWGVGWEYCWTNPGVDVFLPDMGHVADGYSTLPAGNYGTTDPLTPLVGCDLNGEWTLTICDYWSIDDGWMFGWQINFDPDIFPDNWTYQNTYPTDFWTAPGPGGLMTSPTTGTYDDPCPAETYQPFVFTVVDDFGCSYDTTINVFVRPEDATECCTDPVVDILTESQSVCGNIFSLSAGDFYMPGNEGYWSAVPTTATFSAVNAPVTNVTVSTYEAYSFTWTEINSGSEACSSNDNVVITFLEEPTPYAGIDTFICGNTIILSADPLPGGVTGTWSSEPPLPDSYFTSGIHSNVTTVNIPPYSPEINYNFIWTADNGICENSDEVKITFHLIPMPNAGIDSVVCGSIYYLNALGVVGEGYWTVTDLFGNPIYDVIFTDPDFPGNPFPEREPNAIANIAVLGSGIELVFIWHESNGPCMGEDEVKISFTAGPYAYAGNNNFTCGDTIQLNADITGVETLNGYWTSEIDLIFLDHVTMGIIDPATDHQAIAVIPPSEDDVFVDGVANIDIMWNMNNGFCTSSDIVTMTFYQEPVAFAGPDTFVCGQTFEFQAVRSVENSVGTWVKLSGPGVPVYTSPTYLNPVNDPNANVMVTAYGEYIFQWCENNALSSLCGTCDLVSVKFVEVPLELDAGNDTLYCQTPDDQYMAFLHAEGGFGTGLWHSPTDMVVITPSMSPDATVFINHPGTATFCWRETIPSGFSQPCIVEKCIDVTFEPTPNVELLTADAMVCGPQFITVNGSVYDADTAYWFDASHAGTEFVNTSPAGLSDPLNVNDTVNVNIYGHHQLLLIAENHVTIGSYDAVCSDTANVLNLTFYQIPEPEVRATDTACGNCYVLEGVQSMDSTYVTWSSLSPSGLSFSSTGTVVGINPIDTVCVVIVDTTRVINFTEAYPGALCAATVSIAVKFAEIPSGLFDYSAPQCFGGDWIISGHADSLPVYQWTFGEAGEFVVDAAVFNPAGGEYLDTIHWTDGDTMHVVDLMVTSSYGCNSPIYRDTIFEPPVNYSITTIVDETCSSSNGSVVIQGAGGLAPDSHHEILWMSETGSILPYEDSIRIDGLPEGTYQVEITDIYNCKVVDEINIVNTGLIEAVIDEAQFTLVDGVHNGILGDPSSNINLVSLTADARFYRWFIYDVNDSLVAGPLSGQIQTYEFLEDGDYKIHLEVESRETCVDQIDYMYIKILGGSIVEVPNIFTPNGDGINDFFHVNTKAIKSFEGTIVNRWGETLYQWNDWNSPNSGWDGKINEGSVSASPGVYYYIITAVGIDNDKPYEIKGAFHLIREK
ncbi:MAG TPA: hypothetical protein DEA97_02975 [Bacteroidales bacterium]|nr:hypothetical protein [Bacteroidales bacterium]